MIVHLLPPTCRMPTAWSGEGELLMVRVGAGRLRGLARTPDEVRAGSRRGGSADLHRTRGKQRQRQMTCRTYIRNVAFEFGCSAQRGSITYVSARGKLSSTSRSRQILQHPPAEHSMRPTLLERLGGPAPWERTTLSRLCSVQPGSVGERGREASLLARISLGYLAVDSGPGTRGARLLANFPAPCTRRSPLGPSQQHVPDGGG